MKKKVMVIGAGILDILVHPADKSVFDMGSYPADNISMSYGGDGLNQAIVLSHLGIDTYLNTILGQDIAGETIKRHCFQKGIQLTTNSTKEHINTGINVVLIQENGERNFLTNANGSLRKLRLEHISFPFPEDVKIVSFASMFVFPHFQLTDLVTLFQAAHKQDMLVCCDMTKRKNQETLEDIAPVLPFIDYLMPNEEEAYLLTGRKRVEESAEDFWKAGVKHVIIKCGAKGCYIHSENMQKWIRPISTVSCIDTTGAGDSFCAGFIASLAEGRSLEECANFANQCGGKATEHIGATTWCE